MARNQSRSLVPFNKLPEELLAYILSLADTNYIFEDRHDPYPDKQILSPLISISATSKHLRDIMTRTPSIWTNISLVVDETECSALHQGRSYLRYSGQLPLRVCIASSILGEEVEAPDLIDLLSPHAHRIVSLNLQVSLPVAWGIIVGLFSNKSSCPVQELYLNDPDGAPELLNDDFPDRFYEGDMDHFLRSLRVLGLRGFFVPFDTPAYHGLTVLKIMPFEFRTPHPTLLELRNALAACPQLYSLTLIECMFDISPEESIEPVYLPNLNMLDLRVTSNDDELVAIISCVVPGSNTLAFSVSFDPDMSKDTMTKLRHFMERSKVTRLCVDASLDNTDDLNWLLAPPTGEISTIQELALCAYTFEGSSIKRPLDMHSFPSLHTLHLMGCKRLTMKKCRRILNASAIQLLQMDEPRKLVAKLSGIVPSVEYRRYFTICHGESDSEWPVYTLA
ncbi:hypothetical protein FS749_001222 [Ceratobasidium sp. UAMH 11750]|nr:hypothetical protein FS749_001222 [Ceratobasidium sp. UAMH 11750]